MFNEVKKKMKLKESGRAQTQSSGWGKKRRQVGGGGKAERGRVVRNTGETPPFEPRERKSYLLLLLLPRKEPVTDPLAAQYGLTIRPETFTASLSSDWHSHCVCASCQSGSVNH